MFEESSSKFDSIYLLATALDPTLRMFIFPEQVSIIQRHINDVMTDMVYETIADLDFRDIKLTILMLTFNCFIYLWDFTGTDE